MQASLIALFAVVAVASAAQPWLGHWKSDSAKPALKWDEFVANLNVPEALKTKLAGNPNTDLTITKADDEYTTTVTFPGHAHEFSWTFKLGEERTKDIKLGEHQHQIKYKFTEDGEKLKADVSVPSKADARPIHNTYAVNGDELTKTYTVGDITATRYFKRVAA